METRSGIRKVGVVFRNWERFAKTKSGFRKVGAVFGNWERFAKTRSGIRKLEVVFGNYVLKLHVPGGRPAKKQRAETKGSFGHMHELVRSSILESKGVEPGAFLFDHSCNTSWAKQRWHSGKRLLEQEERGSRIVF